MNFIKKGKTFEDKNLVKSNTVLTFESLCPLAPVQPSPPGLYAQSVPFAVLPVALEVTSAVTENTFIIVTAVIQ